MLLKKYQGSKWMVFAVTSMANLGAAFAINSLNIALPVLKEEFGVSQSDVSWLALVYSLIPCCMLLIFGRLADLYGYKRQYIIGFSFFAVVSTLAPILSNNLVTLIIFRCLQGVGYSMLISITQATVYRAFDAHERGKALGINSVFVSVGLASGPSIGGVLIRYFSWHYIFYFSAIFCVLGFIGTFFSMRDDVIDQENQVKMDFRGGLYFAMFIGFFAVGLNFIDDWGFSSWKFGLVMLISVAGLILFIYRETHASNPMMSLSLFRVKTFSLANAASGLFYLTHQLTTYLFPFFLAEIMQLTTDKAGLVMLAAPVVMMLVAPFGGSLSDKVGTKPPAISGLIFILAACIITGFFSTSTSILLVTFVLILVGAGNGLSVSAINSAILGSVPKSQSGVASGMLATMRNIGQTLGTAVGSVMLTIRQSVYSSQQMNENTSFLMAQRDTFYIGIAISLLAIVLVASLPKKPATLPTDFPQKPVR